MGLNLFGNLRDDLDKSAIQLKSIGLELELEKLKPTKFLEFLKLYKKYDKKIKLIMTKNANFVGKLADNGLIDIQGKKFQQKKDISEEEQEKIAEYGYKLGIDMNEAEELFNEQFVNFFVPLIKTVIEKETNVLHLEEDEIKFLLMSNEEVLNTLIIDFKIKCNLEKSDYWETKDDLWENANEDPESPIDKVETTKGGCNSKD